jgi:hypothetical protein
VATEPATPPAELPAPDPIEPETSTLAEHEAEFPVTSRFAPPPEPKPATDDELQKPQRHRSKRQLASPEDVPRIVALTTKWRAAEAERDALKAQLDAAKTAPRPAEPPPRPQPIAPAPVPAPQGKPNFQAFLDKTADYSQAVEQYTEALTDWKRSEWDRQQAEQQQKTRAEQEQARLTTSWASRVEAAKAEYPDFQAVALDAPTAIQAGSLIDAWIMKSPHGARLLYTLQKDPAEVARIQNLRDESGQPDGYAQALALALLEQRFNGSSTQTQAAASGSAVLPQTKPAPRPPNPLRTGPMPTDDTPPGEDSTLAQHEAYWSARRR